MRAESPGGKIPVGRKIEATPYLVACDGRGGGVTPTPLSFLRRRALDFVDYLVFTYTVNTTNVTNVTKWDIDVHEQADDFESRFCTAQMQATRDGTFGAISKDQYFSELVDGCPENHEYRNIDSIWYRYIDPTDGYRFHWALLVPGSTPEYPPVYFAYSQGESVTVYKRYPYNCNAQYQVGYIGIANDPPNVENAAAPGKPLHKPTPCLTRIVG
jgi:hypothetical protein